MIELLLGLLIGLYLGYKTITSRQQQPPKPPKPPKQPQPPPKPPIGRVPPPPPVSPKTQTVPESRGTLVVTVVNPFGKPARGALVTVCGGKPYKCYSDKTGLDGKAVFPDIPYGKYSIAVKWGYVIVEPGVYSVVVDKPLVEKTVKLP